MKHKVLSYRPTAIESCLNGLDQLSIQKYYQLLSLTKANTNRFKTTLKLIDWHKLMLLTDTGIQHIGDNAI